MSSIAKANYMIIENHTHLVSAAAWGMDALFVNIIPSAYHVTNANSAYSNFFTRSINVKTSNNNRTLLHEAVIHGRTKFVRILRRRFNAGKYVLLYRN